MTFQAIRHDDDLYDALIELVATIDYPHFQIPLISFIPAYSVVLLYG